MISKQEELDTIRAINDAIREAGLDWTAGHTSVSRLSHIDKQRLGSAQIVPPDKSFTSVSRPSYLQGVADPAQFDWRDINGYDWMTPVRDQENCGSCWAHSVLGVVEAAFNIYSGNPNLNINLSEQYLVSDCYTSPPPASCSGGNIPYPLRYVRDHGIPTETCVPYIAEDSPCVVCNDPEYFKITDVVYVYNIANVKWSLQEYGPLAICITVPDDWYYYTGGVYEPTMPSGGQHAVVIAGWDDTHECLLIKNSWGTGWGELGYGRMLYSSIRSTAYGITGIEYDDICELPTCGFSATTF